MSQQEPSSPRRRWTGAAVALFVIGLLILVPSGLCTALFGGIELFDTSGNGDIGNLFGALMFGGPFILIGAALVYAGLRARKDN